MASGGPGPPTSHPGIPPNAPELRFKIGQDVQCKVGQGPDGWSDGRVLQHWYWQKGLKNAVPYQVQLRDGRKIFAPMDDDRVIRPLKGFELQIQNDGKVPVTILTGFLGAGKTTLLNYILTAKHGKKYAIIENEVGAVGVDNQLLAATAYKQKAEESITILDNGCLCCTIRGDLVLAIQGIVATAMKKGQEDPDAKALDGILIETTGLADPGPICKTFYEDAFTMKYCKIDGVVTVIDGKNFIEQITRERSAGSVNESAQQVAFADKILLNKIDLCDPNSVQDTIDAIQGVNHAVPIVKCSLRTNPDAIPLDTLLSIDAFDLQKMSAELDVDLTVCGEVSGDGCTFDSCADGHGAGHGAGHGDGHGAGHGDGHSAGHGDGHSAGHGDGHGAGHGHGNEHGEGHSGHGHGHDAAHRVAFRHDTGVSSFVCEVSGKAIHFSKFQYWMQNILRSSETVKNLYRYKGIVCMYDDVMDKNIKMVLQGVHDVINMDESGDWPEDVPVKSQVVFIGRGLKPEWQESFKTCACEETDVKRPDAERLPMPGKDGNSHHFPAIDVKGPRTDANGEAGDKQSGSSGGYGKQTGEGSSASDGMVSSVMNFFRGS